MGIKDKAKNTFPSPFPPSKLQFYSSSNFSTSSSLSSMGGGKWGCGQFLKLDYCCSFLLTIFLCCSIVSGPQGTVLHKLLQPGCFTWTGVLQELLCHESCLWGAVLLKWTASVWVHHQPQLLPENLLLCGLLSTGCNFLQVHQCSRAWGFPGASGGSLLHCGPPCAAGHGYLPAPWAAGESQVQRLLPLLLH